MARKDATRRKDAKADKVAVQQGISEVGYKKPPKEHQFEPGHSGNPKGSPIHRTNLWVHFTKYMNMTDEQLTGLDRTKLTQAQQTALKLVEQARSGKGCGAERMARYVIDREHGKAAEHLIIGNENDLTDEECEQIRQTILRNHVPDNPN